MCRQKGFIPLSTYLTTYKLGDYVDIKVNGAVHKVRPSSRRAGPGSAAQHCCAPTCGSTAAPVC